MVCIKRYRAARTTATSYTADLADLIEVTGRRNADDWDGAVDEPSRWDQPNQDMLRCLLGQCHFVEEQMPKVRLDLNAQ